MSAFHSFFDKGRVQASSLARKSDATAIFDNESLTEDPLKVSADTPLLCVRGFDVDNDAQRDDSLQVRYGADFKKVGYISPQDVRPGCGTFKVSMSSSASGPETALLDSLGGEVKATLPGGTTLACSRDLGIWKFVLSDKNAKK